MKIITCIKYVQSISQNENDWSLYILILHIQVFSTILDFSPYRFILSWWRHNCIFALLWALFFCCHTHWWLWLSRWWLLVSRKRIIIINSLWWKDDFCWCTGICIYYNFFVLFYIVLDILDFYLYLKLLFNKIIIYLDPDLNQKLVIK